MNNDVSRDLRDEQCWKAQNKRHVLSILQVILHSGKALPPHRLCSPGRGFLCSILWSPFQPNFNSRGSNSSPRDLGQPPPGRERASDAGADAALRRERASLLFYIPLIYPVWRKMLFPTSTCDGNGLLSRLFLACLHLRLIQGQNGRKKQLLKSMQAGSILSEDLKMKVADLSSVTGVMRMDEICHDAEKFLSLLPPVTPIVLWFSWLQNAGVHDSGAGWVKHLSLQYCRSKIILKIDLLIKTKPGCRVLPLWPCGWPCSGSRQMSSEEKALLNEAARCWTQTSCNQPHPCPHRWGRVKVKRDLWKWVPHCP